MTLKFTPDAVVFDCDSTLSSLEGIDELAAIAGVREEVAALRAAGRHRRAHSPRRR